jgi:hypothetical protein
MKLVDMIVEIVVIRPVSLTFMTARLIQGHVLQIYALIQMEIMIIAKLLMMVVEMMEENVKILIVWISVTMAMKDGLVMAIVMMGHGDYILIVKSSSVTTATALMMMAAALGIRMEVEMMVVKKVALMISLPVMMVHAFQLHGNVM